MYLPSITIVTPYTCIAKNYIKYDICFNNVIQINCIYIYIL